MTGSNLPSIRAAVVQAAPIMFDVTRTLAKLRELTADAARAGAQLVVFPEAFLSACEAQDERTAIYCRRPRPPR